MAVVTGRGVADVVDALRERLSQVIVDFEWDDTLAQPYEWRDGRVYLWCETTTEISIGTGEIRQDFEILIVAPVDNEGEEARLTRSRDVSLKLDSFRAEALRWIALNANVPPWDSGNIAGRSDEDFLRQLEVRGVAVMVGGYRLVTE